MSSSTLDPLPESLRRGLHAVALFGFLSLTTTVVLFLFLTYRLVKWYRGSQLINGANQFFILIYNLVISDIHQAVAFVLPTVYIVNDKIEVGTSTCRVNGWFVSVGDLASSVSIFAIAFHTFVTVVKGRVMDDWLFYTLLSCTWFFVYIMALLTVILHPHAYARAGAWCWVDHRYDKARLWLHYFWIFTCMLGTAIIYTLIYTSIRPKPSPNITKTPQYMAAKRAARYMIICPVVYVACTLPLAGGRMVAMTGMKVPLWYYCLAGAAITSCGWLDVLLYIFTRRAFVFSKQPPAKQCLGLHTFGWYAGSDFYGTTTTIEGPLTRNSHYSSDDTPRGYKFFWLSNRKTKRHSNEQYFAFAADGVIATKTTVEVTTGPIHGCTGVNSDFCEETIDDAKSLRRSSWVGG